jgi:hypothetical protein
VRFTAEFHMTNDSRLFHTSPGKGRLPLYEGKMIHQFTHRWEEGFRYWIVEKEGRAAILGREHAGWQGVLDYQTYRPGFRKIASNTNERTLIATILPPGHFTSENFQTVMRHHPEVDDGPSDAESLFLIAVLNSFAVDFMVRYRVSANINFFYVYQLPVPRLTAANAAFGPIVERAARLICTTPEFDDLAKEVGLRPLPHPNPLPEGEGRGEGKGSPQQPVPLPNPLPEGEGRGEGKYGVTDPAERARLRAELDGLIAHLYGLTHDEFAYILTTFPLVAEEVKDAALEAYRAAENGQVR